MYRIIQIVILNLMAFLPVCSMLTNAQTVESHESKSNEYILILNSRSSESLWSTVVSNLIRHEIESQNPQTIVNISFAGISDKNSFLTGRYGMQAAFANGRISKYSTTPKVLVLIGDESWMYYRIMNHRGLWQDVPVVLVGVRPKVMNDYGRFYQYKAIPDSLLIPLEASVNKLPVTALVEKNNETYTLWLMKQLMPGLKRIIFLSGGTYQDVYAVKVLDKTIGIQYPELEMTVIRTDRVRAEEWQSELRDLPPHTAVLTDCGEMPIRTNAPVFQLNESELAGKTVVGGYYSSCKSYAAKTADIVLRIYNGEPVTSIPFTFIDGEEPHLNRLALKHFGMSRHASTLLGVQYTNLPTPFFKKYKRTVLILSLLGITLVIALLLNLREKHYRSFILKSMEKYRRAYDEYRILYDNIPMGLIFFDKKGKILNRNQSSDLFFDKVPPEERDNFNLFRTGMIDQQSKKRIGKRLSVNKAFDFDDRRLRVIFRHTQDEDSQDGSSILMLIIDCTNIYKEKAAKERIHEIFSFAMQASALGVAEYNLISKKRFATEAWYRNLCIADKDNCGSDVYRAVVEEDRKKIEHFLNNIGDDGEVYFADTIRVREGNAIHWLRNVIQLVEYGPEEGRVIVLELLLNVDEQKANEQELDQALRAARKSDRLKNAFIANMSSDIRPTLDELKVLSIKLIDTKNEQEKERLMERIVQNNDLLLEYVERIIKLSQTDVIQKTG